MLGPVSQLIPPLPPGNHRFAFSHSLHFNPVFLSGTISSDLLAALCELFHLTPQRYFILNVSFLLSSSEKAYSLREEGK